MTKHEQLFRAVHPKASIEKQVTNGGKRYYLVRRGRSAGMYSGSGTTKLAAWRDAASKLPPLVPIAKEHLKRVKRAEANGWIRCYPYGIIGVMKAAWFNRGEPGMGYVYEPTNLPDYPT